jgi:RNase H-fold protein (predicted Holliday junction resolvase)
MDSFITEDSVTNRIVRQLTEDYETIGRVLEVYQNERVSTVQAQKQAFASYDAEIREIEGSLLPELK